MKSFFLQVIKNADIYAPILLGLVFGSLGLFGVVNLGIIASGILATLALFTLSAWRDRHSGEQLAEALKELDQRVKQIIDTLSRSQTNIRSSDVIRQDVGKLDDVVAGCRQVFMAGVSLYTRTNMLKLTYQQMLRQGCNFRFIVLDPSSPVLAAHARLTGRTPEDLQNEINGSLALFASLKAYAQTQQTSGRFEFAVFDYDPALLLMRFEYASSDHVLIQVELPVYQTDIWKRPVFRLTRADGSLFTTFDEVCTKLWVDATPPSSAQPPKIL
jgi:hypothetical protein